MVSNLPNARARDLLTEQNRSFQALAFARYLGSLDNGDLFNHSGPVAISIEASLPGLYKGAELLAVRDHDESAHAKYYPLAVGGDGTVLTEVIGRYLEAAQQRDDTPSTSSLVITPANYKFHFAGEVRTGGTPALIYRITPKKSGAGLLNGQVWMDPTTGAELMLTGHVTKLRSTDGFADIVRETKLWNGTPYVRVTHLTFAVPNLGPAELVVTESLLRSEAGGNEVEGTLSAFAR